MTCIGFPTIDSKQEGLIRPLKQLPKIICGVHIGKFIINICLSYTFKMTAELLEKNRIVILQAEKLFCSKTTALI